VRWFEPDPGPLGSPFIVMDQVDGIAPPDVMPYNFGSWLMDASLENQRGLQDASVRILAEIHGVDATPEELAFLELVAFDGEVVPGDTALRRHVNDLVAYYEWVRGDDLRVPVIEAGFAWIEDNWPVDEGAAVISWGDSRIGNILYRDFEPVAVLDWEMAAVAPREVDIGWMIFLHDFFEHVAQQIELPGMPHFMRRDDVAATYEAASGVAPRNLEFYELYAALRHAIVMARVTLRAIHFGESEMPADADELVLHRNLLRQMVDGSGKR
jgi:aminoglycoside phosphotransferase (APT) family kinase protein